MAESNQRQFSPARAMAHASSVRNSVGPRVGRAAALVGALLFAMAAAHAEEPRRIVLVGGSKSEGPGRHDYPNAIRVLRQLLDSSPDLESVPGLDIESHPDGWP